MKILWLWVPVFACMAAPAQQDEPKTDVVDSDSASVAGDNPIPEPSPSGSEYHRFSDLEFLELDHILKLGSSGDRVRELQATLNKVLLRHQDMQRDKFIRFDDPVSVGPLKPSGVDHPKDQVRVIVDEKGRFDAMQIRGDWEPLDESGAPIEFGEGAAKDDFVKAYGIKLPAVPLKVDGVYGQRTYGAVMLFQQIQHLPITGEVDAVTLDKLEPMVPTNPMLAAIMNWVETKYQNTADDKRPWRIKTATALIMTLIIVLVSGAVFQIARSLARSTRFLSRWLFTPSTSPWFNTMRDKHVFERIAQFASAIFIYFAAIAIFPSPTVDPASEFPYLDVFQDWHAIVSRMGLAYAALVFVLVSLAIADACNAMLSPDHDSDNPVTGIVQAAKRIVVLVGLILIVAPLAGVSPWRIIGGLGAFMAIILLVFRDYILGLVASIQIIANRMVEVGDWIEMPTYGADGDVIAMSLNVIKVRNFDRTISTIPTHFLMGDSFRNWSEMHRAGGRRIKRAIYIDVHSIVVCTPTMIERFKRIKIINAYVSRKLEELRQYNVEHEAAASPVNCRRLTNIGTFRAYLEAYLSQHPGLNGELTILVRHMQPTSMGLPVEVYAYCSETRWKEYEAVQADIFDHVLAILPEFELRAFQDVTELGIQSDDPKTLELRSKFAQAQEYVIGQNLELARRPASRVHAAQRRVEKKLDELGIGQDAATEASGRILSVSWRNGPP